MSHCHRHRPPAAPWGSPASASRTRVPTLAHTQPACPPSQLSGGGGVFLPPHTTRRRGPGERPDFSPALRTSPLAYTWARHTNTNTHTHTHRHPPMHQSFKYLLSTYYVWCRGLVLGAGDSSREQTRRMPALGEPASQESTYITRARTDARPALTVPPRPRLRAGTPPLPVNERLLG